MTEHYFTPQPSAPFERLERTVRLRGQEVTVTTAGGTFSPGRLDPGTAVLLKHVPDPPATGTFVDLGCGWGPLTLALALAAPAARVIGVDVNERALELTALNAARAGLTAEVCTPQRAEAALAGTPVDLIWSNPPIRVGKQALHELLQLWLGKLSGEGTAYLVVAKNLGADSLARWIGALGGLQCERAASSKGYRLLKVSRAENTPQ